MNENENIIKNNVLGRKTYLKNEIDGNEYSNLLNRRSRRRGRFQVDAEVKALKCPSCGATEFSMDHVRFEKSCAVCGLVIEENMVDATIRGTSRDKEGNSYGQNGAPKDIAIHDGGLSTTFDINRGYLKDKGTWIRIRRMNNQSRVGDTRSRNLSKAFAKLALIVSQLSLSKTVRRESASIYRKALDEDLIRGRSIDKLIVATIYIACRQCDVPRTLDEISEGTGIDKKTIGKNYRFLSRELGIKLPVVSPNAFVPRFASKLGLSSEVEVKSIEIINLAKELGITSGKDPASITAASLYWACLLLGERRTQTEIAKQLGVTEVTIRNRFNELKSELNLS